MFTWLHRTATAVLICAAVVLSFIAGAQFLGMQPLLVKSGSMGRAIPIGSLALGKIIPASEIGVGDVVLVARSGAEPFIHRVIDLHPSSSGVVVRTQGDANPVPDAAPYTLPGNVTRVDMSIPWLGYLLGSLVSKFGLLLVIVALPAGAGLLWILGQRRDPDQVART